MRGCNNVRGGGRYPPPVRASFTRISCRISPPPTPSKKETTNQKNSYQTTNYQPISNQTRPCALLCVSVVVVVPALCSCFALCPVLPALPAVSAQPYSAFSAYPTYLPAP